jgi:tRNA threonylcarbamoyladenosine biosynthesis protein TsaB
VTIRIVALETSDRAGSVAAAADSKVLSELQLDPQLRSAQSLAPAVHMLLKQVAWPPSEVQLFAVTIGPGSFTGLRVGVATAKVLAYASGAEILGVGTLDVIAASAPAEVVTLSVGIDAQRGDVVCQQFQRAANDRLEPVGNRSLLSMEHWFAQLPPGCAVSGPVLKKWTGSLPDSIFMLDPVFWDPTAANVARLAYRDHLAGRRDDIWQLLPLYSRPSAAEEKWRKKDEGADKA